MRRWLGFFVLLSVPSVASAQAGFVDAYGDAPVVAAPRASVPAGLAVMSRDEARGVPTLLVGRHPLARRDATRPRDRALSHVGELAAVYGLTRRDLETLELRLTRPTPSGGAVVIFGQRPFGVEAFETRLTLLMDARGALVAAGGQLRPTPARVAFARTHQSAIEVALADRLGAASGLAYLRTGPDGYQRWTHPGLDRPVRVKRVLYPLPDRLVPAHYLEVWARGEATAHVISADDGALLARRSLTAADAFEYAVFADPAVPTRLEDSPFGDTSPDPLGRPVEALPPFVAQVRVMVEGLDPWLPAGAIETVGNNVDAYADIAEPDGRTEGDFRATVTAPGVFAHPFDPSRGPRDDDVQTQAGITHLFYVTNWMHDFWYDLGFDEAAGNAQADNFGRGGEEGDPLHAEAADYSRRNNANMTTPRDGDSPRMQMFLWNGLARRRFTAAGSDYPVAIASFGPLTFDVTGPLALADDGVDPTTDACSEPLGDLTGAIALVDRGSCGFLAKTRRAEAAGAVGVIVINDQPGDTRTNMTGTGTVGIPTMMVSQDDGAMLRAMLGTSARMTRETRPEVGSSFDTQVVTHEWGHFLHHRLLSCGSFQCAAQSEGWGDFVALLVLMEAGDDLDAAYPTGSYSNQGFEAVYFGTRRIAYSASRAFDDLSFRHIADGEPLPDTTPFDETTLPNSEVHNAGEIWASMMFDALVAMLRRSETAGAPYDFDGARRQLGRYVVTGMQLAPRAPTYTEQRDAIVAAALEHDVEDARLIAEAFAGRGAGTCAIAPLRYSEDFVGVMEDFEVDARPIVTELEVTLAGARTLCDDDAYLDVGETGWVRAVVRNDGVVPLRGATLLLEPNDLGVSIVGDAERPLPELAPGAETEVWAEITVSATDLRGGPMDVRARVMGASRCGSDERTTRVMVDRDPGLSLIEDFELEPRWLNEISVDGGTTGVWTVGPSVLGDEDWVLRGAANGAPSDTAMELPEVHVVSGVPFVLRFDHRFHFEGDDEALWDGGVIEYSTDAGGTWRDVAELVDPGYTGPLTDRAMSTLADRPAYSRRNASFPRADTVRLDFGTMLEGEAVRFRFRIATDASVGAEGWEIDDLVLTGVDPPVFPSHVADGNDCSGVPVADAGEDREVTAGDRVTLDGSGSSDPDGDPLSFGWALLDADALVTLSDARLESPSFVAPTVLEPRAVRFRLEVRDGHGGSATDDVTITVVPDETVPIPDAGAETVDAGRSGDGGLASGERDAGPVVPSGGGCSCRAVVGRHGRSCSALLLAFGMAFGMVLALRRRR
ncbi:MAG: M36 family metallopeptidase [Myxococcales bacterium]|nr:M36 family metallopeptidase [Myxococcales bacterium]